MLVRLLWCCTAVLIASEGFAQQDASSPRDASMASAVSESRDSVVTIVRSGRKLDDVAFDGASFDGASFDGASFDGASFDATSFASHEYGTGVVIGSSGLVLTNYHLLGDVENSSFGIWHRRRLYVAKVIAADPWTDLAILKANNAEFSPITIRVVTTKQDDTESSPLAIGQPVFAFANPYEKAQTGNAMLARGTIQDLAHSLVGPQGNSNTLYKFGGLLQIDVPSHSESSGSPLLDIEGRMIGLVTSAKALEGYDSSAHYAIPLTKEIYRVIETLMTGREVAFGFLGIDPDPNEVELTDQKTGVRVKRVLRRTPAAKGRILAGDIITHVDGAELKDVDDLLFRVGIAQTEDRVQLRVVRTDPILRKTRIWQRGVRLAKRFVAKSRPVIVTTGQFHWRGLQVDYYSAAKTRSDLTEPAPENCVRITGVDRDSATWEAGLRVDHLVTAVGGISVGNPSAFEAAILDAKGAVEFDVAGLGTVFVEAPSQE
ncbi:S1C family serine protease [Planctomycetota bacterium]